MSRRGACIRALSIGTVLAGLFAASGAAQAHGFAGKRFFPATLVIDDPFVADELSLPTVSQQKFSASGDEPATKETALSMDWTKRITENFGVGFGANYLQVQPEGGERVRGFDNLEANVKYQFYKNDEHETILSAGLDIDIGGSGAKRVGAESFSTFTPALFFGKGFGDLPDDLRFLRPFAVTGQLGVSIPSRSSSTFVDDEGETGVEPHANFPQWGFALQYSLIYLQSFVKDVGLRDPFNRMIAVVEVPLTTGLNRGASGTTGTVNPGLIWSGRYAQLALEAQIPINSRSGRGVSWIAQLHFYLDDMFPKSLGRPLFGQ
ncbi:MAG TPA: hypothetical protein VFR50_05495 [Casimicrobiaceae bacterium]|nr:hypothetical protein [Casimicrobiaceae bacterium]